MKWSSGLLESSHPDDHFQSRYVSPEFKPFSCRYSLSYNCLAYDVIENALTIINFRILCPWNNGNKRCVTAASGTYFIDAVIFVGIRIQKYDKVVFSWEISVKTYQGKNVSSEEKGKVIYSLSELTKREFKAGFKQQKRHLQRIEWTHLQQIPEA